MKLKPGCGCLILVLALCNLVFVVADIVAMFVVRRRIRSIPPSSCSLLRP